MSFPIPPLSLTQRDAPLRFRVREITSRRDKLRLIQFPWRIYKGDRYWVPPLISERVLFLDPKRNPSFEHLEVGLFLAEASGALANDEVVGTIAAIINHKHNEFHGELVGFFGLFETINNQDVASALLEAAEGWVRERLPEATAIRGPMNFSTNDECGMLVDGFDSRPVVFMTYNPPYYPELVEVAGYETAMDMWAYKQDVKAFLDPANPRRAKLARIAAKVQERYGITVRQANLAAEADEMRRLKKIYNSAWERNWGFVPVTEAEMEHLAEGILKFLDPELVFFAEKNGEPVGFALTLPDVNIPVQKANGRLFPIGWLRYLWARRKIDWVRVFALGVTPEFRNKGLDSVLYLATAEAAGRKGYRYAECSWILASNGPMNATLQSMGPHIYKTYRVYEKSLQESW